jgi:hypothetical protein
VSALFGTGRASLAYTLNFDAVCSGMNTGRAVYICFYFLFLSVPSDGNAQVCRLRLAPLPAVETCWWQPCSPDFAAFGSCQHIAEKDSSCGLDFAFHVHLLWTQRGASQKVKFGDAQVLQDVKHTAFAYEDHPVARECLLHRTLHALDEN